MSCMPLVGAFLPPAYALTVESTASNPPMVCEDIPNGGKAFPNLCPLRDKTVFSETRGGSGAVDGAVYAALNLPRPESHRGRQAQAH